jgi:hypothetical protein
MAWNEIGHRIICEIAFQELEQTAREHSTQQLSAQDSDHPVLD